MSETLETTEEGAAEEGYGGSGPMTAMGPDMAANPQPVWKALRDEMPVMPIEDLPSGSGVLLSRKEEIMEALRHPEIFSSNMDAVDLSNKRPMIPLQIDPPDHKKFRKLLDPIFAPRKMAALDDEVSALVNNLIDGFIDRGEVDFATEFSVPFPSEVFLTLLGLPLDELDRFLTMKDGIIRPDHVVGKLYGHPEVKAYQQKVADSVYEYFNEILDQREVERRDDILSLFLDADVEGDRLTREDILDICFLFLIAGLDTVTATLDCMFSFLAQHPDHRRQLVENPDVIPNAIEELLRWETPVMGIARGRGGRHRARRVPGPRRGSSHGDDRLGQHRRGRVPRRRRGALRPRRQPPHRLRWWHPPLPRLAPGSPRVAGGVARVAQAHSRIRDRGRAHARLHAGHPLHRPLPDALHGIGVSASTLRRPPSPTCSVQRPSCQ